MTDSMFITFAKPTVDIPSINATHSWHWSKTRQLRAAWKEAGFLYGRQAINRRKGWEQQPVVVPVSLPFAQNRRRDAHNYTGTVIKWLVDGLVAAGIIPDDSIEWLLSSTRPCGCRRAARSRSR